MGYSLSPFLTRATRFREPAPWKTQTGTRTVESGHRHYSPELGRWLSKDPLGDRAHRIIRGRRNAKTTHPYRFKDPVNYVDLWGEREFKFPLRLGGSTIIAHPDRPGWGLMVRDTKVAINRCNYLVLLGHASDQPGEMTVKPVNAGCAYGTAYGCFTGGGEYENPAIPERRTLPDFIEVPPVVSPGIPGAPAQPDDLIIAEELVDLGEKAYLAALSQATSKKLCKMPCCCTRITVKVQCLGTVEFSEFEEAAATRYRSLCGKSKTIECSEFAF